MLSDDLQKLKENFNTVIERGVHIAYEKLEEGAELLLQKAVDPIANAIPNILIETVVTKLMPAAVTGLGITYFSARHPEIFQAAASVTAGIGALSFIAVRQASNQMAREEAQAQHPTNNGPQ